jgi:phage baseplate assembly protein W
MVQLENQCKEYFMGNKVININTKTRITDNKQESKVYFSDVSLISKPKMSNNNFAIVRSINVEAVKNSLRNIFSWQQGERILDPEFGSRLREYLYQGLTQFNIEQIISEINRVVLYYEPRVTITEIRNITSIDDQENNIVRLDIIYKIIGLNDEEFNFIYTQRISS